MIDEACLSEHSTAIIKLINDELGVLEDRDYSKWLVKEVKVDVLKTMKIYKSTRTLMVNALIPYECWTFSPEYEIAIKQWMYSKIIHYSLQRIKNGYGPKKFTFWCGSSNFAFTFLAIPIAKYEDSLAQYLPAPSDNE